MENSDSSLSPARSSEESGDGDSPGESISHGNGNIGEALQPGAGSVSLFLPPAGFQYNDTGASPSVSRLSVAGESGGGMGNGILQRPLQLLPFLPSNQINARPVGPGPLYTETTAEQKNQEGRHNYYLQVQGELQKNRRPSRPPANHIENDFDMEFQLQEQNESSGRQVDSLYMDPGLVQDPFQRHFALPLGGSDEESGDKDCPGESSGHGNGDGNGNGGEALQPDGPGGISSSLRSARKAFLDAPPPSVRGLSQITFPSEDAKPIHFEAVIYGYSKPFAMRQIGSQNQCRQSSPCHNQVDNRLSQSLSKFTSNSKMMNFRCGSPKPAGFPTVPGKEQRNVHQKRILPNYMRAQEGKPAVVVQSGLTIPKSEVPGLTSYGRDSTLARAYDRLKPSPPPKTMSFEGEETLDEEITESLEDGHPLSQEVPTLAKILLQEFAAWRTCQGYSSSTKAAQPTPSHHANKMTQARKRAREPDENETSDGDEDQRKKKSKRQNGETCEDDSPLLACPFYKHDEVRHQKCLKHILRKVKNVKEHLRRCHKQPNFCPLCGRAFDHKLELDGHLRARACDAREFKEPEGITEDHERSFKLKVNKKLTLSEQWKSVWRIIFPAEDPPDSPFIEGTLHEGLACFRRFRRERGAMIISEHVRAYMQSQNLADGMLNPERILRALLETVAGRAMDAVIETYYDNLSAEQEDNRVSSMGLDEILTQTIRSLGNNQEPASQPSLSSHGGEGGASINTMLVLSPSPGFIAEEMPSQEFTTPGNLTGTTDFSLHTDSYNDSLGNGEEFFFSSNASYWSYTS